MFKNLLRGNILIIYLDYIIIQANNKYEGLEKMTRVLEIASKVGLELNLKTCEVYETKVSVFRPYD